MAITTLAVFMVSVGCFAKFSNFFGVVDNSGDNRAYINVAAAIKHWSFHGLFIKHFWGLPYVMAAVSTVTRTSDRASLLLVCLLSSVVGTVLAFRLWGGWVAGFFAVLNFEWMQRSCLGGSEPLFVVLLFASFLAVRRERWILAALLASFSTTVRPLGFLALAGIGLTLLWKREYRTLSIAVAVGAAIGAAYVLPLWWLFGDPLATAHSYQSQGGHRLFGLPLYAIIKGTFLYPAPWTSLVLSFGWILFVLAGTVAMFASESFRTYFRSRPVEIFFAVTYLFLIFSYNSPYWARGTFQRFAIPIIPFVVSALLPWIPKSRGLLWGLGIVSPVLAAASAIGIRNVFHIHS
ncbi:MAG TPA: hypothetical protein VMO80_07930 [Terriglobales bacterium]|nr:hypothetical protein [Terriglobales bacterium]